MKPLPIVDGRRLWLAVDGARLELAASHPDWRRRRAFWRVRRPSGAWGPWRPTIALALAAIH